MATMWQVGRVTRDSAQEFKRCARDMGMAEEDTKVHLVSVLNQDTPTRLDAYIIMRGGDEMAHLETVQDRLHHIPYVQILAYLKQGELSELAR